MCSNFRVKAWSALLTTVCSMAILQHQACGQDLRGRVTDSDNRPIYHANLRLVRDGVLKARASTNHKGQYHFWPIGVGAYQAILSADGKDQIVRNIEIKGPGTTVEDFAIKKRKPKTAKNS